MFIITRFAQGAILHYVNPIASLLTTLFIVKQVTEYFVVQSVRCVRCSTVSIFVLFLNLEYHDNIANMSDVQVLLMLFIVPLVVLNSIDETQVGNCYVLQQLCSR